ncbi:hypothetical protein KIPB_013642 [Kipferlia bialata]|uniref:Uncharacterized protein n=1 Tax=Kipferlia bialata TaxID=797122 RepID=A0A9K3D7R4_9EUKA|nr:hypothetical protein KIPB_013642 [Kipferlia bialata]|eukprot:g13642.t1
MLPMGLRQDAINAAADRAKTRQAEGWETSRDRGAEQSIQWPEEMLGPVDNVSMAVVQLSEAQFDVISDICAGMSG